MADDLVGVFGPGEWVCPVVPAVDVGADSGLEVLQLTGKGGLLPGMIKQAVEAAMHAEMTDHLGYERYAAQGRRSGNSRNGTTTSSVHTNVGPVQVDKPRDVTVTSTRWSCRKAPAGWRSSTTWFCRCSPRG